MIRVRFAPSPTGLIHIGNIRTALMNYLFAKQKGGKFILRIEDTDKNRNIEGAELKIIEDLLWLGIKTDENPQVGGPYGPYLQSERTNLYQEKLDELIEAQKVYRCFCSEKELEVRRARQLSLGQPPRYDRACLGMSDDMIKQEIADGSAFVWRLKINEDALLEVNTMARGVMKFEMKNFGDFALTRSDGSFKFMFTNFVDDWLMEITHVIRGEDHLSNTAMQGALFDAFSVTLPTFWHLPLICGADNKRLSKRDRGFALNDLQEDGFLPQAICNYLATSGTTFDEEVQSLEGLAKSYNFDKLHSTGSMKYDVEKLRWFNHKWIQNNVDNLAALARPYMEKVFNEAKDMDDDRLQYILNLVRTDVHTLNEFPENLRFYFEEPVTDCSDIDEKFGLKVSHAAQRAILEHMEHVSDKDYFLELIKKSAKSLEIGMKPVFGTLRYMLTGKFSGPSIADTLGILGIEKVTSRLKKFQ